MNLESGIRNQESVESNIEMKSMADSDTLISYNPIKQEGVPV